jgi:hypothetical protein
MVSKLFFGGNENRTFFVFGGKEIWRKRVTPIVWSFVLDLYCKRSIQTNDSATKIVSLKGNGLIFLFINILFFYENITIQSNYSLYMGIIRLEFRYAAVWLLWKYSVIVSKIAICFPCNFIRRIQWNKNKYDSMNFQQDILLFTLHLSIGKNFIDQKLYT